MSAPATPLSAVAVLSVSGSLPPTSSGGDATAGPISPSGPRHTPPVHASCAVLASRSSHDPPSLAGAASQEPSAGLHAPTLHTSSRRVQSGGVPSPQRAEPQVVSSVHGSPSSHGRASL